METNHSEDVPKDFGNVSEDYQNPSESVPKDSEKPSEAFGTFPHKERTEHHTLTVRDVAHIFEENKLSVTERTITNWCKPNAKGVCRLDAVYEESDYRYYITPQSVERVIKEEGGRFRKLKDFFWPSSEMIPNISEGDGPPSESFRKASATRDGLSENVPNASERNGAPSESFPTQRASASEPAPYTSEAHRAPDQRGGNTQEGGDKLFELQAKVMELQIENKAKDFFIDQLKNDRETFRKSFDDERRQFVELISKQATQIGEYKEKLLQLGAPRHEGRVHDTTIEEQSPRDARREDDAPGSERYYPGDDDGFGQRR